MDVYENVLTSLPFFPIPSIHIMVGYVVKNTQAAYLAIFLCCCCKFPLSVFKVYVL